jgi:RNA polymerase-binding transcription factor DksA
MTTLTADQSRTLENLLIAREKELTAEIAAARDKTRQHEAARGHEVIDRKEDATEEAATEVSDAEVERDMNELKAVQAARLRFNAGLYGTCVDCEEPIALQRLMAQPAAVRCTRCQAGYEEKHSLS